MKLKINNKHICIAGVLFLVALSFVVVRKTIGWPSKKAADCSNPKNLFCHFDPAIFQNTDQNAHLIIIVINPHDCLACGSVTKFYLNNVMSHMPVPTKNIFYIFPKVRSIELRKLIKDFLPPSATAPQVISDGRLYKELNQLTSIPNSSFMTMYNRSGHLLLSKSFKEFNF